MWEGWITNILIDASEVAVIMLLKRCTGDTSKHHSSNRVKGLAALQGMICSLQMALKRDSSSLLCLYVIICVYGPLNDRRQVLLYH